VKQYDVSWADLPAPIGRRPVLLLTRSSASAYLTEGHGGGDHVDDPRRHHEVKRALGYALDWPELKVL